MPVFKLSAFADESAVALKDQIEALHKNGLASVEMRTIDGISVANLTKEQAKNIHSILKQEGITLSALGSPYGKYPIEQPFEPHLEAFRHGLDLALELEAPYIRMFSFFMPENANKAEYRSEVHERIAKMLEYAADAGVQLVHENEKAIYGDDTQSCLDLQNTFFPMLGQVFDPANFIQCGVHPEEAFPQLYKTITYMHIKDAMHVDGSVVPAGKGEGHVEDILRSLTCRGGQMFLTVEPHLKVFSGLNSLQGEELHHRYTYQDNLTAFGAAVDALKVILSNLGYREINREQGLWGRK